MTILALDLETTGDAVVIGGNGAYIIVKEGVVIESDEESAVVSDYVGTSLINNGILVADTLGLDAGYGVELNISGGHVIDSATGIISGGTAGIRFGNQDCTVENQGIID